jgi:hypothetical protein
MSPSTARTSELLNKRSKLFLIERHPYVGFARRRGFCTSNRVPAEPCLANSNVKTGFHHSMDVVYRPR